ncbi:MAG: GGDEF domain-containing protein [Lachnospiraceae bacterium]|nr:GGDEF domain-containing protein [Lachnospiraceae bacterium]
MDDKSMTIAVMMRDVNTDFSEAMYSGMYDTAKEENINLVYLLGPQAPGEETYYTGDDIDSEYVDQLDSVFDYAELIKPDALIIVSGSMRRSRILPDINALTERYKDIPMLVLETIPGKPSIAYQVADSYQAMCECVEHLIVDHNCSFIVYVSGDPEEYDFKERLRAFKDTMNAHALNYSSDQIVVCDSPDNEERRINAIFDDFPYMDALVCSCDSYARIAYRACNKRGIVIGKDLAVTGFDDLGMSHPMTPGLTGVMYNSYGFGSEAVKKAVKIAKGLKIGGSKIPCKMVKRNSCGCVGVRTSDRQKNGPGKLDADVLKKVKSYIEKNSVTAVGDIFSFLPYESEKIEFGRIYSDMFSFILKKLTTSFDDIDETVATVSDYISKLTAFKNISNRMVTEKTTALLEDIMYMIPHGRERAKLTSIMIDGIRQLKEAEIVRMRDVGNQRKEQLWFIPLFTKDLMDTNKTEVDVITNIMRRLRGMNVASAHIFIFHKPVVYRNGQLPPKPTTIHYAGRFDVNGLNVYLRQNGINIDTDNGISSVLNSMGHANYTAFVICSGNRQYGIILYEIEKKDIFFAMMCTLQIGALFNYRDMSYMAADVEEQLKEKESILDYVSDRDDLTGILNGCGFVKRLTSLVAKNNGRKGYIILADVSYLSQINGQYGHEAGDRALKAVADKLVSVMGEENPVGRIGDDEFISMILCDKYDMIENIRNSVNERLKAYNDSSADPYDIEISLEAYEFVCDKVSDISDLIGSAVRAVERRLSPKGTLRLKGDRGLTE